VECTGQNETYKQDCWTNSSPGQMLSRLVRKSGYVSLYQQTNCMQIHLQMTHQTDIKLPASACTQNSRHYKHQVLGRKFIAHLQVAGDGGDIDLQPHPDNYEPVSGMTIAQTTTLPSSTAALKQRQPKVLRISFPISKCSWERGSRPKVCNTAGDEISMWLVHTPLNVLHSTQL